MATGSETQVIEQPAPTKLYLAMHKARTAMGMVAKGGKNAFDHYMYATLADYLDAIQKPLDDNGLIVVSHIENIDWQPDRETAAKKFEKVCRIMLRTTVIHAESGEQLSVTVLGEGQDRGDKAFYKADTGARKYALANLFNLATSDDPEVDSQEPASAPADKPAATKPAAQSASSAPSTTAAEPAKTDAPRIMDCRAFNAEQMAKLVNIAEHGGQLLMTLVGAIDGRLWNDHRLRGELLHILQLKYKRLVSDGVQRHGAFEKRMVEEDAAYKAAAGEQATSKQELDSQFEELQKKLEAEAAAEQTTT